MPDGQARCAADLGMTRTLGMPSTVSDCGGLRKSNDGACLLLLVFGTHVGIEAGPVGLLMLLPGLFLAYAVGTAFFMADADTAQEILTRLWSRTSRPDKC